MADTPPKRPRRILPQRNPDSDAPSPTSRHTASRRAFLATGSAAIVGTIAAVAGKFLLGDSDHRRVRDTHGITQTLQGFHTDGELQPGEAQVLPGTGGPEA